MSESQFGYDLQSLAQNLLVKMTGEQIEILLRTFGDCDCAYRADHDNFRINDEVMDKDDSSLVATLETTLDGIPYPEVLAELCDEYID